MRRSIIVVLFLTGCFGTETGNPPYAPAAMGLRTSDPSVATFEPNAGALVIDEGWVAIAAIHAIEGASCDRVGDPSVERVQGELRDGIDTDGLAAGSFCGLHVVLGLAASGGPDAFTDRAILVRGTTAGGTPFEIASESTAHGIDVLAPGGELALEEDAAVLLTFDAARWAQELDLDALEPDADGVVRVEPGDGMLAPFELGFASSLELFRDIDGDAALDPTEEAMGPLAQSH